MSLLHDLQETYIDQDVPRDFIVEKIRESIAKHHYKVVDENIDKPWGAFWRFDGAQAAQFITDFFPDKKLAEVEHGVKNAELSPKILLVAPRQRLSWQYHHRRAELWRAVAGTAGYYKSSDDDQGELISFQNGTTVQFDTGERHRLTSGDSWSIVAEIWQHADPSHPSDEDDIVRVADDYAR